MRLFFIHATALAIAFGGACQSPESPKATTQEPDPGATSKTPPIATPAEETPHLNFKVDGKKLAPIALGDDTVVLSIGALPPIEDWKTMIVRNVEGREFRAVRTALLTGENTMRIVKLSDQSYEFRVMKRVGNEDTIRHRMPKAKVLEIQTHSYTPPHRAKGTEAIAITGKGKARSLDKAALDTISRTPEPGTEKNRDTWLVLDLLGEKSLPQGRAIVLKKRSGEEHALTSKELGDPKAMHIIKRNRRGQFHYRGWTLGETPAKTSELRNIVAIELR